jgi:hypothetical protein
LENEAALCRTLDASGALDADMGCDYAFNFLFSYWVFFARYTWEFIGTDYGLSV